MQVTAMVGCDHGRVATYRLYLESDLNRVFTASLGTIAASELDLTLTRRLDAPDTRIAHTQEGRTGYLRFDHAGNASELAAAAAQLSATAALFIEHSPTSLEPLALADTLEYGTELVTAQRYKGKTSERLTRLMLNVARAADQSKDPLDDSVIDPMCGRGTTLNWALLYGMRSTGLDIDLRALDDYATFLQQWAKGHRLPHKMQRYKKGNAESRHFDFTVAADRAALDAKTSPDIRTFHAPADAEVAAGRHSMLVSDLPYGIQHRAKAGDDPTSVGALVETVSARWPDWVRTGGAVALSWNVRSLSGSEMVDLLDAAGFDPVHSEGFEHVVDRTITRDVVVARRRSTVS